MKKKTDETLEMKIFSVYLCIFNVYSLIEASNARLL